MRTGLVWVFSFVVAVVGCAESQPPVSRLDTNITAKSDLEQGEWYFLQTVVDTPFTASFTFVGEQSRLERVRWEVQKDFLVARRTYENVAGADGEGINGTEETSNAPVAMYRISKHFDIRRSYNPTTGEELNVIEENTERPWNEREFVRVDWSENLITNPDFLMIQRYFNGLTTEPVAWFVEDEDDPNAPHFERDEADELDYIEITNKLFATPETIYYPGIGEFPSCLLLQFIDGYPSDCAASEITVRNSFMRADDLERDYEPFLYTGERMDRFGYFVTERPGYDRNYGLVEPLRYRFANRHNLWMQSHERDEAGELVACTVDADCTDGRGSRCDTDWGRARRTLTEDGQIEGACTIPYRDRETRPVVYHATESYPEDLYPELGALEADYNRSFVDVVSSLREIECMDNGGADCAAERTREDHQQMYVVCTSPVPEGAHEACGEIGNVARIGDMRKSIIGYVSEPHRSSPLGYGPSAADPLTGEILAGNAFLYGAGLDNVAAYGRDILRLLNGDITADEISEGAPVQDSIDRLSAETEGGAAREAHNHAVPVDGENVDRINAAMDFSWIRGAASRHDRGAPSSPAELISRVQDSFDRLTANRAFGDGTTTAASQLARLEGTEIERMMTNRDARAFAGIDPDLPVDEGVLEAASPLRGMRMDRQEALERARTVFQQHAGVDFGDFGDEGLLGLARTIQRTAESDGTIEWNGVEYTLTAEGGGIDYEAVTKMLRHPILTGLMLHEVGHTVGLRHNFAGSSDSWNYSPRYWELRDDGNMRSRAWDPLTEAEIDGRINEHAYASVMDYGHNFIVTDANGLGHYDRAAMKMGYGDLIEVFENPPDASEVAWIDFIQSAGWPVTITLASGTGGALEAYSYTDWPSVVGGRENLENRRDVSYDTLVTHGLLAVNGINRPSVTLDERFVAVPYDFCSDEQADLSPGCYRYDMGADAYESVQSVIDSYWNYYIWNNFRRQRIGFNVNSAANRSMGRYFRKVQRANQTYALYRGVFQDSFGTAPGFDEFWTAERGMGPFTLAVGAGYQLLTRVVTAPEPGGYSMDVRGDGTNALMPGGGGVNVDGFDGRYLETTWNFDAGYFWFDQLERVGYFYDKILAIQALTDPTTYFLGRDTDSDIRRYQLNYASTFGPSMTRFIGGLLGEDWQTIAPRVEGGELRYPDALELTEGSMPGTPLAPNASFSIQLYAAVYGMALIPQTYDQEFLNRSRVWVRGGAEEVEIDPSLPTVEYTDPASGLTYAAVSYPGPTGETGVGAQLVIRAQTLAARAETDPVAAEELDSFVDNLDVVRLLTWHLGFGAQP